MAAGGRRPWWRRPGLYQPTLHEPFTGHSRDHRSGFTADQPALMPCFIDGAGNRKRVRFGDRRPPTSGEHVARAKRTDRAEARRRYRASLVDPLETEDLAADEDEAAVRPDGPARSPATNARDRSSAASPARPSIVRAFRSSFRPIDVRGDLRALPMLLRSKAFLIPVLVAGASVAALPFANDNPIVGTLFQYFAGTAPLGTAFIAGFLAPRASWLIGGLACLAAVAFEAIAFTGSVGGIFDNFKDPVTNLPVNPADVKAAVLSQALVYGVPMGVLFASAAAWYKRFLNRASPSRQGSAGTSQRPDGKQPKRNEPRPMLARRR
jgi:hypothetical protein